MKAITAVIFVFVLCVTGLAQNGPNPVPHSVTLNWTASPSSGVTGYWVYRGTSTGVYTLPAINVTAVAGTSYVDTTVTAGKTYHYAITATNGTSESVYSADVSATIPLDLAAPGGVSAAAK